MWKIPHAVKRCRRCHLLLHFHCAQCWQHISKQNRHNTWSFTGQPSLPISLVVVCLQFSPLLSQLYLFLLFCHSSLHLFPFVSFSPYQFSLSHQLFPPCFLYFLLSCQFSHLPPSLERWAHVSAVYSVSGTFQLARTPASGCVGDKMEQIPPGYCYLCFPAVTHKQSYTFTHVHSHMSLRLENARVPAPNAADALGR